MEHNRYLIIDTNNDGLFEIAKFLQNSKSIMMCDDGLRAHQITKSKYKLFDRFDVFSYALSDPSFKTGYTSLEYKYFVPKLQFKRQTYEESFDGIITHFSYCNFDIICSDCADDKYKAVHRTSAINLDDISLNGIKSVYVVYSDETYYSYAVVLSKSNEVSMVDILRTALCSSFQLNSYLMNKGFDVTGYTDYNKYDIIQVPFNRSQPVVKGSLDGKCIIKNPDDKNDAEFKVCAIYNREV